MTVHADLIEVLVAGAAGRMGSEVVRAVTAAPDMEVIAVVDPKVGGATLDVAGAGVFPAYRDVPGALASSKPDVMVDFTHADAAAGNVMAALEAGVHCVVGTTGLAPERLDSIRARCQEGPANCLIAPNFAIGAVLMMRLSEIIAKWMPSAEIIELHHDRKADAPSGTARMTAERIARARRETPAAPGKETETVQGSRGGLIDGVPVHSVRLPGLVAHQEVVFGGQGQVLTIRHDSVDRSSFMPGVLLGVRRIAGVPGLTLGLDDLLELG